MKKRIITFLSLIACLVLTGCAKKVSYKESLNFKEVLTASERTALIAKINHALSGVNEIVVDGYTKNETELSSVEVTVNSKLNLYSDYQIHAEATTKTVTKANSVTVTNTVKTTMDEFYDDINKMHISYQESDNGDVDFALVQYTDDEYKALGENFYY